MTNLLAMEVESHNIQRDGYPMDSDMSICQ